MAIEVKDKEENDAKIAINPRQARASTFTIGYFLAQSAEEVKRFKNIEIKVVSVELLLIFDVLWRFQGKLLLQGLS